MPSTLSATYLSVKQRSSWIGAIQECFALHVSLTTSSGNIGCLQESVLYLYIPNLRSCAPNINLNFSLNLLICGGSTSNAEQALLVTTSGGCLVATKTLFDRMYQSFFSYNITRPYPTRWLTPVVVIGGILATALVSLLNVVATGYELFTITSTDPNATLAQPTWFDKWRSFKVSTKASCDSTEIPLQARLYTNNTAFPYTLYSVWKLDESSEQHRVLGSLVYFNQPLQRCNVSRISIDIDVDDRTGGQMALIPVGATVTTVVDCAIDDSQGRTYFQLFGLYNPVPVSSDPTGGFLARNQTSKASLWWGESIMRLYWASLMMDYYNANLFLEDPLYKGVVTIRRESNQAIATADEVMGVGFFSISCFFNNLNSTGILHQFAFCDSDHNDILSLFRGKLMPSIWDAVNILGKATYFSILADLGRSNDSGPNMLADPNLLANLSQHLTQINQTLESKFRWGIPSLAQQSFDLSQAHNTSLGVSPAILAADYICQVPKLKTGGTLFVSILVADLVQLQALWTIFKFAVDTFWIGKKPELKSCGGCATSALELNVFNEDRPLLPE